MVALVSRWPIALVALVVCGCRDGARPYEPDLPWADEGCARAADSSRTGPVGERASTGAARHGAQLTA
eukprot:2096804-Prymnesium_polylepis.2